MCVCLCLCHTVRPKLDFPVILSGPVSILGCFVFFLLIQPVEATKVKTVHKPCFLHQIVTMSDGCCTSSPKFKQFCLLHTFFFSFPLDLGGVGGAH